jgi:hypothetical protein
VKLRYKLAIIRNVTAGEAEKEICACHENVAVINSTAKKCESHIQFQNTDNPHFVIGMSDVKFNGPNFNISSSATHMGVPVETHESKLSFFSVQCPLVVT